MRSLRRVAALALAIPVAVTAQSAPVVTSSTLHANGKSVEVIGLHRWTIAMIQDSLAKYAPGEGLDSHACAANLRYKLHFADASATEMHMQTAPDQFVDAEVVAVIEPQDSARVHYRRLSYDTAAPYAPWARTARLMDKHLMAAEAAIQTYARRRQALHTTPLPEWASRDSAVANAFLHFADAHHSAADLATARRLLASHPDSRTRLAAVLVLQRFVDRDDVARDLLRAVLERDGAVKGMASTVLGEMAQASPRHVVWGPVADDVHAVLDGTSLFELGTVMRVMRLTGAGPDDAAAFLRGGGRMLIAYMGASQPWIRADAHQLLVALRGADLGEDPAVWERWIATL